MKTKTQSEVACWSGDVLRLQLKDAALDNWLLGKRIGTFLAVFGVVCQLGKVPRLS